jgi:hypothetical protein
LVSGGAKGEDVQTRNPRKVRRVIGCELRRQLREPGNCCSISIVGGGRWEVGGVRFGDSDKLESQSWCMVKLSRSCGARNYVPSVRGRKSLGKPLVAARCTLVSQASSPEMSLWTRLLTPVNITSRWGFKKTYLTKILKFSQSKDNGSRPSVHPSQGASLRSEPEPSRLIHH